MGNRNPESLHILYVEDHAETAAAMLRLFRLDGHYAIAATSCSAALELLKTECFDLAFLDLGLPDGDGCDLLRQIRKIWPVGKAVALTGYGFPADIRRCEEAGFDGFLLKPIDFSQIREVISRVSHASLEFAPSTN